MLKDKNHIKELEVLETLNEKELREISGGETVIGNANALRPKLSRGLSDERLMIGTWPTPERVSIDTVPLPE